MEVLKCLCERRVVPDTDVEHIVLHLLDRLCFHHLGVLLVDLLTAHGFKLGILVEVVTDFHL